LLFTSPAAFSYISGRRCSALTERMAENPGSQEKVANMGPLGRLASVARGAFWLLRSGGLRQQLNGLEGHLAALQQEVADTLTPVPGKMEDLRQEIRTAFPQPYMPDWVRARDLRAFEKRVY
jgi:hypothetical protein